MSETTEIMQDIDETIVGLLQKSELSEEELGELHHACVRGIKVCRRDILGIMIKAGRYYLIIQNKETWRIDGSNAPTFEEWLKDPDHCFGYGKARVWDAISFAKLEDFLFQNFNILLSDHYGVGYKKMRLLRPHLALTSSHDEALHILQDGRTAFRDLQKEYTDNPYFTGWGTLNIEKNCIENIRFNDQEVATLDKQKLAVTIRRAKEQNEQPET